MRFLKIIVLLIALTHCAPLQYFSHGVCRDENGRQTTCTKAEQAMIDTMRGIISQIAHLDMADFAKSFAHRGSALEHARVIFFGEKHTEIISQIGTLAALNALAQRGDYLLLEGSGRGRFKNDCALLLIFQVYLNWQWESLGQRYSVGSLEDKQGWRRRKGFEKMLRSTIDSYNLSDLNLSKLRCGFWDDAQALADTMIHDVNANNFLRRNQSMVHAINDALAFGGRVFIVTGYLHMPIGDYLHNRALNSSKKEFPKNIDDYYQALKSAQARKRFSLENTAGTTEPIYNYLKNNNIPYAELLHGRLIYQ